MFSWLVRIAAYILAAVAMIRLMQSSGTVHFQPFFIAWLNDLREWVELPFLFDALRRFVIDPTLAYIRSFGWHLPELREHWRQFFVLMWLGVAAVARHDEFGSEQFGVIPTSMRLTFAFLATLTVCIIAGLLPIGFGSGIVAASAIFAYFVIASVWLRDWRGAVGIAGLTLLFFIIGIFIHGKSEPTMLWIVAGFMVFYAAYYLVTGLGSGGSWKERLNLSSTKTSADILAAMAIAFSAVVFLSDPPMITL